MGHFRGIVWSSWDEAVLGILLLGGDVSFQMSRYNPFAKPKIRPLQGVQSAPEFTTAVSDAREDVGSAVKVSGGNPFGTRDIKDKANHTVGSNQADASGTTSIAAETLRSTVETTDQETILQPPTSESQTDTSRQEDPITAPVSDQAPLSAIRSTPTHRTITVQPPPPASQSLSRWRLLWRGGLEVGQQRYKLEGIAFCAKMTFSVPSLPRRESMESPTGKARASVVEETPVGSVNAILEKETTMADEGSYFPHNASGNRPSDTSMSLPVVTPTETTPRPRRPMLNTQPSASESAGPLHTPGGSVTAKAFETSDPDLCLSLESMKGRQTLRVRGVERLGEDEVLGQDGESGVHVCVLVFRRASYHGLIMAPHQIP